MRPFLRFALATISVGLAAQGTAMAQTSAFPDNAALTQILQSRVEDGRATGLVLGVANDHSLGWAIARAASSSCKMTDALSCKMRPSPVSLMLRRTRSNSLTPSSSSSSLTCFEIPGCEVNSDSAASETLRPWRWISTM